MSSNTFHNATEAFEEICRDIHYTGLISAPRGQKVNELIGYGVRVTNPRARVVATPARKTSLKYLLAEWIWYLSGQNHIDAINEYAPFWAQIAKADGTVNSNYGYRIFGMSPEVPYNQWEKVKELLKKDPDSRQAIIHINAGYDYTYSSKDVPCTLTLQWFIRENKLILKVNMRSNDAVLGFVNDCFQFTMLQELMMLQLRSEGFDNLELGEYIHDAGSMHIYERHFEMKQTVVSYSCRASAPLAQPMIAMEYKKGDIENLIAVEKLWRETFNLDRSSTTANYVMDVPEFKSLSPYWQKLIMVFFFNYDSNLIMEA